MYNTTETLAVIGILNKYFFALEDGFVSEIYPAPNYTWKFYKGDMSIERMRRGITILDDYCNLSSQHGWAERNHPTAPKGGSTHFDSGADLNRLPDNALLAMFQELDSILQEEVMPTFNEGDYYAVC